MIPGREIMIAAVMLLIVLEPMCGYLVGKHNGERDERTRAQAELVTTMQAMAARSAELATADAAQLAAAEKRRRQTQATMDKLSEQVTDYEATYSPLDDCALDDRGVQLWNAANAGTDAPSAGAADGAVRAAAAAERALSGGGGPGRRRGGGGGAPRGRRGPARGGRRGAAGGGQA